MNDSTRPSDATRAEEADEAAAAHEPGRGPTADEEKAAERNQSDPAVAESYRDMTKKGAEQQGEGQLP